MNWLLLSVFYTLATDDGRLIELHADDAGSRLRICSQEHARQCTQLPVHDIAYSGDTWHLRSATGEPSRLTWSSSNRGLLILPNEVVRVTPGRGWPGATPPFSDLEGRGGVFQGHDVSFDPDGTVRTDGRLTPGQWQAAQDECRSHTSDELRVALGLPPTPAPRVERVWVFSPAFDDHVNAAMGLSPDGTLTPMGVAACSHTDPDTRKNYKTVGSFEIDASPNILQPPRAADHHLRGPGP